ncbi:MAG: hypothetical protein SCM96_10090 [Acidobacteriota bacterium]|nr:hypothetical protein [Acidobacteriota bacterium]
MFHAKTSGRFSLIGALLPIALLIVAAAELNGQRAEAVGAVFEKLSWRNIGPAVMGGRTVDIQAVEAEPWIVYAAIGPSGIWKTENGGHTWNPVFFKENTVSVGAVAVSQSHPDIVWAGTGEATCRNSVTIGDGVYKSVDAGKTWTHRGLTETRHISRILINRGDPNIVYVAAMGHLWGPNGERGVYKTTDGGTSWSHVLYLDDNTGIAELAMDPFDSRILYAAAYEYRRLPWHFSSGGPGSGLYKSTDGGATWDRLTRDLPEGLLGRIGIGVSRSREGVVYALIEHADAGIWRSEDKGATWERMCDNATYRRVMTRPFYYSRIHVDPTNDATVYVLSTGLHVSNDGARRFRSIGAGVHPDHHALWINPANPRHLINGNDGGIDISHDGGTTWSAVQSMDLAQVYQVGFDMRHPYHVHVGLQDNGSWGGPNTSLDPRGVLNEDWVMINGGDGFFVRPDPEDHAVVYANSQMNGLVRHNLHIGRSKSIRPTAPLDARPYRFNWNSPVLISSHDSKTVYTGGNFLFRTRDGGRSWDIISPDLTTDDPAKQKDSGGPIFLENSGAEMHCTITTIAESPLDPDVIWCGTDDGNLQLTRDGGKTWTNVAGRIPGLPRGTWCSRVEASHHEAGTVYAAFDAHRTDDYAPYLFKTSDFGRTWKSLRADLPPLGWIHVVREDPKNSRLLYVGTEFGVFASLDGGLSWFSLKNNMPTVAVHDLVVHPRENDLIAGTHGRGVWILDDISFLQDMSPEILASDFHVFKPRPVTDFHLSTRGEPYSRPVFAGRNVSPGAILTMWLKDENKDKIKIAVRDESGEMAAEINLPRNPGLHREIWNLQTIPFASDGKKYNPSLTGMTGLTTVAPGLYHLTVEFKERNVSVPLKIRPDPRVVFPNDERQEAMAALGDVLKTSQKMGIVITALANIRRHLNSLENDMEKIRETIPDFTRDREDLKYFLVPLEKNISPPRMGVFQADWETSLRGGHPAFLLMILGNSISGYPSAPTRAEINLLADINQLLDSAIETYNTLIINKIEDINGKLEEKGFKPFPALKKIENP